MNNLRKKYLKEVLPALKKEFNKKNDWAVIRPKMVSVNVGLSKALENKELKKDIVEDLKIITGQAPVLVKSRKSISGFKVRQGQEIGTKVNLRGEKMWDFIERFVRIALPRTRDFQGIKRSCVDDRGNFNYGIKEQLVFPEISHDDIKSIFSLQVNISTAGGNKEEGLRMFELLGFQMQKK
jgi:large subunit ribosomal protein L5